MAKKATKTDAVKAMKRPNADDVKRAIGEASRLKTQAAEYGGFHGQAVKSFVEKYDINRKAFNFARSLHDMEEGKREAVIVDFLELADKLGFLDQGSLFDSVRERAADVAERLSADRAPTPGVTGDVLAKVFGTDAGEHADDGPGESGEEVDRSPVQAAAEAAEAADLKLPPFLDRRPETKAEGRKRARQALDLPEDGVAGEAVH